MGDVDETLDATFRVGAWIGQVTGDGGRRCGLAVLLPRARESMSDKRSCTLQLYDFVELDSYSNLESLLIQLQLSQLYLASGDANEAQKVAAVAEATNTPCEPAARALFSDTDVLQRIQALSGESAYPFEKDDLRLARLSCGCLLAKSRDLREAGEGAAVVERGALSSFMRLDMAAIRALNLLPSGRDEAVTSSSASGGSRLTSLWALLSNRCKTRAGRVTVRSWLLQPLVDTAVIEARLDVVEALMEHESLCSTWHAKVAMPDLDAYSSRLVSGRAGLADLVRLYAFIHGLPGLITMLESATGGAAPSVMAIEEEEEEGGGASSSSTSGPRASSGVPDKDLHPGMRTVRSAYLAPLRVQANDLVRLRSLVDTVLVDVTDVHHPRVKRGYKEELGELGEKLDEAEGAVEAVYSKAKSTWGLTMATQPKLEYDRQRGYVFRVSRKEDKSVDAVHGATKLIVLKDGIVFTTERLSAASAEVVKLRRKYDEASAEVIAKTVAVAATYVPALEAVATLVGRLDALQSMACLAKAWEVCTRPSFEDGTSVRRVRIEAGRHPLLELQDGVSIIPNNYTMDEGEGPDTAGRFHLVTGPNMGGKSTYIRTLGVLAVLAQVGSFLPATAALLPPFDAVLARVGAGDAALKGVSTFMAEMLEAGSILSSATPSSLVIIDELGRGTSTYDGFGLAWAISERLAYTTRAFTLFATHFHELCALADESPVVKNSHVKAQTDNGRITMLYALRPGPCPASFGVHVAELAGFPPSVVETARAKAAELEATSSALLQGAKGGAPSMAVAKRLLAALAADASIAALPPAAKRQRVAELLQQAKA